MSDKFYARITRPDGSVTFKGPWTHDHCKREALAWVDCGIARTYELMPIDDARAEVRAWAKHTKPDSLGRQARFFPAAV